MRLAGVAGLAATTLLAAGCATASAEQPRGEAAESAVATVQVVSGPIESTLVVPAVIEASPQLTITARVEGRYSLVAGRLRVQPASGGPRTTVRLPAGVAVTGLTARSDVVVPVNHPVASARVDGFALVARLDLPAMYRLYATPEAARGQIDEGPGPFDCPLADPVPRPAGPDPAGDGATLTCIIPREHVVFSGMPGVVSLRTGSERSALLLPLEAVAGDAESGTVLVVRPGRAPEPREVRLGVSDGARIVVESGLREGDTVQVPGPDLGRRS